MRIILFSICSFFCFCVVHAQNANPFELHSGILDSTKLILSDSINLGSNQDTLNHVPATPVVNEDILPESVENNEIGISENQAVLSNPFDLKTGENNSNVKEKDSLLSETKDSMETSSAKDASINADEENIEEIISTKTPIDLPEGKNSFVFWISLLSGLLLSILFTANRKILNEIIKSLSNLNYMKLFQKEERNGGSISFLILYIIYVLNAAVFIRFALIHFEIPLFAYNIFLLIGIVAIIVLLRHLSLSVVSYLRKKLPDAINYSFIIAMVNSLTGLILIPINLLIAFGPNNLAGKIVFLGLVLLVLAFILKWLRGFVNSARIILGDSFHFLLYLCTCEIVPICFCIGFLRNLIN